MVGTRGGEITGKTRSSRPGVPLNKSRGGGSSGSFGGAGGPGVQVGEVAGGELAAEGSKRDEGVGSWIDFGLRTIHPNPSHVGAGRVGHRERRRVRRVICGREGRERDAGGVRRVDVGRDKRVKVRKIVTWNVRRLSMREQYRDRLRRILDEIGRQG